MKRLLAALAMTVAVATLTACGGNTTTDDGDMTGMSGMSHSAMANTGAGHNTADMTFAQSMIPHHQQAVEMAKLATGRSGNPAVKQLAQRIADAQQPEITTMTGWLHAWGAPTPEPAMSDMPGMSHGGAGMMTAQEMSQLSTATGTGFDRMFLEMMVRHHQGALDMANAEQSGGQYAEATAAAKRINTTQTTEIAEMRALLAAA